MRLRLTGLVVAALLVFAYRGTGIYLRYFSAELSSTLPLKVERSGDYQTIKAIDLEAPCFRAWAGKPLPRPGDRVLEIYDHQGRGGVVRGMFDYGAYIKPINVSHPWTLVVGRPGPGGLDRLALAMPPSTPLVWGAATWLVNLAVDFYLPFLAVLTGLLIGLARPRDNQAYLASLLFMALALVLGSHVGQYPPVLREMSLLVGVTGSIFLPYLVFLFFLRFPVRSPLDRAVPWLNGVFLVLTVLAWAASLAWQFSLHLSYRTAHRIETALGAAGLTVGGVESVFTALAAAMILLALVSVVLNARLARRPDERRRLRIVAAGAVAGLLPAALLLGLASARVQAPLGVPLVAIPLIGLFPLSFAYAVVRHRVFGIRLILRRGLKYALVSRGVLLAEGAAIFVVLLGLVGSGFRWLNPESDVLAASAGAAIATLVLTLGMRRVHRQVLPLIDRRFFRDAYDTRRILTDLSRVVRRMASRPCELLECVAKEIGEAVHPVRIAVFLRPDAMSGLAPLSGAKGACWSGAGEGEGSRLLLYLDETPEAAADLPPRPGYTLSPRTGIEAHLASSAAGEPEALDVFAFESPAVGAPLPPFRADMVRKGGCLDDQGLLGRFGARLVVPLVTGGRALGFLLLGEKLSEEPYSREDRELLTVVAGQVAIALDYAHLIGQAAEQAALLREVQIAQQVQARLFPHERPPMRSLRYSGICRAARGVGGDFYDFLPLTGERLGLALADIAGKGLPAALLMASLQALLRSHAPTYAGDLGALGAELNRHLVESSDGARFASLFFGVFDDRTRELRYLNAGHLPPIIMRGNGGAGPDVRYLDTGGMVLGIFAGQAYQQRSVSLEPGDRIVIFSDGVTEASAPDGEMFGEERLVEAVDRHRGLPAEDFPRQVLDEVTRFVGGAPQQDDITVIAAQVV